MEAPRILQESKWSPKSSIIIEPIYEPQNRYNIEELIEGNLADYQAEFEHKGINGEKYILPPLEAPTLINSDSFLNHLKNKSIPSIHDPLLDFHLPKKLRDKTLARIKKKSVKDPKPKIEINKPGKDSKPKIEIKRPSTAESSYKIKRNFFSVGYANLHKPNAQIPLLFSNRDFNKIDVLALNELDMDPSAFANLISVPIGYQVFYHKPVIINHRGFKKERIYSALIVRKSANMQVKQVHVGAPCTSIFITNTLNNGQKVKTNVSTVYRTHYDSHCKNIALKIYNHKTPKKESLFLHNQFYLNGPKISKPSYYTRKLRKILLSIKTKALNVNLSDREIKYYFIIRKLYRMSVKSDYRKSTTGCEPGEYSQNEIYKFTRTYNPKDKMAIGNRGDHSPDSLLDYYIKLQTKDALPVDKDLDVWPDFPNKLKLEHFNVKWKGKTMSSSLQKCLYGCKKHTKGINSRLSAETLGFFPAEFAELLVKMTEVDLKCGMTPEIHRTSRLAVIPKLSHKDLALITANRFLSLVHVLCSLEAKYVCKIVSDFLEENNYFHERQMGFRRHRGCDSLLALMFYHIRNFGKSETVTVTLLDGRNAFGSVSPFHISKVFAEEPVNRYLKSIFLEKTVTVINNGKRSRTYQMPSDSPGTPQGYCSSPTIYNLVAIMIPFIFDDDENVEIFCFADDLSLLVHHPDYNTCMNLTRQAILKVEAELAKLGVALNLEKTEMFVYGEREFNFNKQFPIDATRFIPETLNVKLLGLRFNACLELDDQYEFLYKMFIKHRALINCALMSNSRISLINLISSTFYGNMQFAITVWPNINPALGNKLASYVAEAICDVYGLGLFDDAKQKHSYRKLFCMTGLMAPRHTQAKLICGFSNRLLYAKSASKELREILISRIQIRLFDRNYEFKDT